MLLFAGIREQVFGFRDLRLVGLSFIGEKRSQKARLAGFASKCRVFEGNKTSELKVVPLLILEDSKERLRNSIRLRLSLLGQGRLVELRLV